MKTGSLLKRYRMPASAVITGLTENFGKMPVNEAAHTVSARAGIKRILVTVAGFVLVNVQQQIWAMLKTKYGMHRM